MYAQLCLTFGGMAHRHTRPQPKRLVLNVLCGCWNIIILNLDRNEECVCYHGQALEPSKTSYDKQYRLFSSSGLYLFFFHFERPLLLEYLVRTKTNNQTKLKRCKVLLGLAQSLARVARAGRKSEPRLKSRVICLQFVQIDYLGCRCLGLRTSRKSPTNGTLSS